MESTDEIGNNSEAAGRDKPERDLRWIEQGLDDLGEYSFETDHVAVKGNSDYQLLIRTLAILEGQLVQSVKNLERLQTAKTEALNDPMEYVKKLQRGEDLNLPQAISIAEIPNINWSKYNVTVPKEISCPTRADGSSRAQIDRVLEKEAKKRRAGPDKPENYNQPWTSEEQQKLEELLRQFPPEAVVLNRYRKIAQALGNRTALQVQSRVQKYFIKLQKAKLPVPGRTINYTQYAGHRKVNTKKYNQSRWLYPASTFSNIANPPMCMTEEDDTIIASNADEEPEEVVVSDDEEIPESLRSTDEYQEFIWLKLIRKSKEKQQLYGDVEHEGYKCDHCLLEPIIGTRWHCYSCPEELSVDYCDSCAVNHVRLGYHAPCHKVTPVLRPDTLFAQNNTLASTNYLDASFYAP